VQGGGSNAGPLIDAEYSIKVGGGGRLI